MPDKDDTELGRQINAHIEMAGPISLASYMRLCLTHPTLGYYRHAEPFGKTGDFITAPEISQMFGEMIGFFFAAAWQQMGGPETVELVELGPGRGTLMGDALRALDQVPRLSEALSLTFLETNPGLRTAQQQRLAGWNPRFISEIEEIAADGPPLLIIANEFFDTLPVRQYQRHQGKWHERMVGLREGKRELGLSPSPMPEEAFPPVLGAAEEGEVWEACPLALETMTALAQRIAARKGLLLVVDYGYERTRTGETFQAVSKHEFADPFAAPGDADLTAHVDFEALARAAIAGGAQPWPLLTQGQFLGAMGIAQRAEKLVSANPGQEEAIKAALERLTAPDAMGTLFKTLCVADTGLSPYPFSEAQKG